MDDARSPRLALAAWVTGALALTMTGYWAVMRYVVHVRLAMPMDGGPCGYLVGGHQVPNWVGDFLGSCSLLCRFLMLPAAVAALALGLWAGIARRRRAG